MDTFSKTITTVSSSDRENPFIRKIPMSETFPATLGARASSFLVDYILVLLILMVSISVASIFKSAAPGLAGWIVTLGYLAALAFVVWNWGWMCVREGHTIGQRLVGLKIVRADGAALDYRTILLRHLIGYPLSAICAGLGFLWMVIDGKQRGWHDKLAGTIVVKG